MVEMGFSGSTYEKQTREKYIDPELKRRKWLQKYIKEEVNSVKSDFVNREFLFYDGHPEKKVDRFIDYVLLDGDYSVLAIIEAKRFSKDEEKGRIQARTYAKDIEKQTKKKIPIFLTNGQTWRFIDEDGIERKVSGPFSQEDLGRRGNLYGKRRNPSDVKVVSRIVDRPKSIQIVRELSEHFSRGNRKALVHMATGTGKTRVAMAIINVLIDANMVRNALFIADRTALVDQAKSSGFQEFFTEPVGDLRDGFSTSERLYVSTVQTLMSGKPRLVEQFSPGFFDLIVFDEAHRSYYDKNNFINKYFDAIKIGLTATPREHETRNTYNLFGCEQGKPTVEYSYDEAIIDKILVPYRAEVIDTWRLLLGIKGSELTDDLKDQLRRQEVNPEEVEFTGSQFDRVFMDEKINELIIREFLSNCYRSDEGKPCKSIFFCASQRHAKHMKKIFGMVSPRLSNDVQVITSEMYRASDEVRRFGLQSEPRIALSVGMLDTGVDIPEVCNLVFVKPVFSHIRFWQMIGRGTRNVDACKHPGWLPNRDKNDFLIFDFKIGGHSNIYYHEFTVSRERSSTKDVITRIFENRVKLLRKSLDDNQKRIITEKIIASLDELDKESFIVREKLPILEKIKGESFNLRNYVKELVEEITPLMIFGHGKNVNVSSFILNVEKLFGYVLDQKHDQIENIRQYVQEMCENILQRDNLTDIRENRENIIRVLQEGFWEDLTFYNVEFLVVHIAPLMKYYEPDPNKIIQIDAPDVVLIRETYEKVAKEDEELQAFLKENPLVKKIREGEGITSSELVELELQLSSLRPGLTIDNVQKFQKVDFLSFLRKIIGLTHKYDPRELIEYEFDKYVLAKTEYNSKQLEFLLVLKKVFANRKRIELSDFADPPLSNEHPLDYFRIEDLKLIVEKCNKIKML
ncbi:MAG: DEAD/DEAH box helicase family protein [Candidatus Bathyarchaeota archaeon]|nr:DEAD/DEAH box helicase family protein [Candidatus Bathyarchaeota archaeon]